MVFGGVGVPYTLCICVPATHERVTMLEREREKERERRCRWPCKRSPGMQKQGLKKISLGQRQGKRESQLGKSARMLLVLVLVLVVIVELIELLLLLLHLRHPKRRRRPCARLARLLRVLLLLALLSGLVQITHKTFYISLVPKAAFMLCTRGCVVCNVDVTVLAEVFLVCDPIFAHDVS